MLSPSVVGVFLLLCSLLAAATADNCKCVSAAQVAAEGILGFPDTYGAGCADYDASQNVIAECSVTEKPAWCHRQWCYVNISCYDVFHPSHHMVGGLVRSYEACGELSIPYFAATLNGNYVSSETRETQGTTLRAFMLNNSGGWKGSFLDATGANVLRPGSKAHGDSPFVGFAKSVAAVGRFSFQYIDPTALLPDSVFAQLVAQNQSGGRAFDNLDEHAIISGCALGTSLNLWDVCIGEMWVTKERAGYAKFLPSMGVDTQYLIVQQEVKSPTFAEHMESVFDPFTKELWAVILIFLIIFGGVLGMIERGGGDFEDTRAPLTVSTYMALLGYSAGPNHAPITPGGRIVYLGFGWLILILGASYTANLASLLVVANSLEGITSMSELTGIKGATVCVPFDGDAVAIRDLYPALEGRVHVSGDVTKALMDLEAGTCAGAVTGMGDLEVAQSEGRLCTLAPVGTALREVAMAFAVSLQFADRLSSLVSRKLADNQLSHLYNAARPVSTCPSRTAASSSKLGPKELSGVLVPSAAFLVLGVLVWLLGIAVDRRNPKAGAEEAAVVSTTSVSFDKQENAA